MFKDKISLKAFFVTTVIIAVLISGVISFFIVRPKLDNENLEAVLKANSEIAVSAESQLASILNEQINIIKGVEIAHHGIFLSVDVPAENYYELILEQNDYLVSLEVIDLDGMILYSSRENENREGISLVGNELYERVTGIHQAHFGGLVYDTGISRLALEIMYSGEDVIVLGRVSVDYLTDFGAEFKDAYNDKGLMILDNSGIYIYDSQNDQHLIQNRFLEYDELLEKAENEEFITDIEGESSVFYVVELEEGWKLIIYEDVISSLQLSRLNLSYFSFTSLTIMILMAMTFLTISFALLRSLKSLSSGFSLVQEQQFEVVKEQSVFKEINHLRKEYNDMVVELDYYVNRLHDIAYYDGLTGIPSKSKAREDFKENVINYDKNTVFLYIDIVRFGVINYNYGYDVGDNSLKQIASTLQIEFEHLYRIEGDEFLAITEIKSRKDLNDLIDRLEKLLFENVNILGTNYNVKLKYGISKFLVDGTSFDELLKKSVIAAENVKSKISGKYEFYDHTKTEIYDRLSRIELFIDHALQEEEFHTVFQPVIDVKTNQIRGFEALSRWNSKDLGNVSPDEFIPILERNKQVHKLDEMVLKRSLLLSNRIYAEFNIKLVTSVNISVETIMRDDFVDFIDSTIKEFSFDPTQLELEITESTIITDFEKITDKMNTLRKKGIKFSEDDFGDKYSSLTYLSRLSIDTLKISRNFLSTMLSNEESRVLVQTIIGLSQRLGFYTIVEGVETKEIFELFKEYGCDFVQGYYFYKPMPDKQLLELMKPKNGEE